MTPIILNGVEYGVQDVCGHCLHRLIYHVQPGRLVQCAICHCLRHPGEDVTKPRHGTTDGGR